jgi:hypothetical protein
LLPLPQVQHLPPPIRQPIPSSSHLSFKPHSDLPLYTQSPNDVSPP